MANLPIDSQTWNTVAAVPPMQMTKNFEGFRSLPYNDTRGIPTIGYGYNLQANPNLPRFMTQNYADTIFPQFYGRALEQAKKFAGPVWGNLNPFQQAALTDMSYNLGGKLFNFKDMRKELQTGNSAGVKREMKNSKWYSQVGRRSKALIGGW